MNIREMSAQWKEISKQSPSPAVTSPTEEKEEREYSNPILASVSEQAAIYSIKTIKHNEQDYEKWDQEKKIANCSRKVANFGIRKGFNGLTERIPRYCNYCEECYENNTLKLKTRVETIVEQVLEEKPEGQWRKKIASNDREAKSLKKRIKRNQEGNHLELACTDNSGKVEIWSYVENEPDKDDLAMENAYGKSGVNPVEEIDFNALYKKNRSTGKKLSTGSGFRKSPAGVKKTDTERVILPDILVKDVSRIEEAEEIIKNTNFIKVAKDADEAKRLYLYQFKFILKELKAANIEIAAIKLNFFNMAKSDILNDWNMNVQYWMSTNNPQSKNSGAKVDTSRLVYPKSSKREPELVM